MPSQNIKQAKQDITWQLDVGLSEVLVYYNRNNPGLTGKYKTCGRGGSPRPMMLLLTPIAYKNNTIKKTC